MDYIHDAIGYNYRMVNVLAAIGVAQMETFEETLQLKKDLDSYYRQNLRNVGDIVFQDISECTSHNGWLFTFRTFKMRELLAFLNNNGIQARPFWMPMNQLKMFQKEIYVTEKDNSSLLYNTSISVPSSASITEKQLQTVVRAIKKFYKK